MIEFLNHTKRVTCIALVFIFIAVIAIPLKIQEHKYIEVLLITAIICFLLILLFILNRYFYSMALKFEADEKHGYFFYEKKDNCVIEHIQVNYIKVERQRYVFVLNNGEKIYLSRINGKYSVEKEISPIILNFYSNKIKY